MALEHTKYTLTGRKFNVTEDGKPTGQKVYKGGIGQVNVLDGKDYKPYVWDAEKKICKFNRYELRFVTEGVEIWEKNTKLIGFGAHPEIEKELTPGEFDRKTATVSGLTTKVIENEDSADRLEISYNVETEDFKSNITFEMGGAKQITFGYTGTAKTLDKLQRTTLEFDQEATLAKPALPNLSGRTKYVFKDSKSYWLWEKSEDIDHKVSLETDKTEVYLKEKVYSTVASVSIKPDTWGPSTVTDADDGFEHNNTTWYDDSSGNIYVGDYGGAPLDVGWMWTVTDADLPGATIADAGTDIEINVTGIYNGGAQGELTIVDDRSPGTWGSSNRPSQQTIHPDTLTWNEPNTGVQVSPSGLHNLIQARIDGDDSAGAFESGDKIAIIWNHVGGAEDSETYWSEGVGDLTIEFTPAGSSSSSSSQSESVSSSSSSESESISSSSSSESTSVSSSSSSESVSSSSSSESISVSSSSSSESTSVSSSSSSESTSVSSSSTSESTSVSSSSSSESTSVSSSSSSESASVSSSSSSESTSVSSSSSSESTSQSSSSESTSDSESTSVSSSSSSESTSVSSSSSSSSTFPSCESSGSYLNEDMADISDWTDGDTGNGVSDQTTFDSKSCMRFDTNTATIPNYAYRYRDVGSFGDRVVVEFSIYHDAIGTLGQNDYFRIRVQRDDVSLVLVLASDGLWVFDGLSYNEIGTNVVAQDTWQKWVFDIDFSTPASATVNVHLNDNLVESDVDCSYTGSFTDGNIDLQQYGQTSNDMLSYIDYIRVGDSCGGYSSSSSSSSQSASASSSSSSESTSVSSSSSSESTSISSSSSSESVSISISSSSSSQSISVSSSSRSESTSVSSSSESLSASSSSSSESTSVSSSSSSESTSVSSSSSSESESVSSSSSSESTSVSSSSSSESVSISSSSSSESVSVSSSSSSESASVSSSSSSESTSTSVSSSSSSESTSQSSSSSSESTSVSSSSLSESTSVSSSSSSSESTSVSASSSSSSLDSSQCESNASYLNENMADITDWTDDDNINAESTQETFDSKSCLKMAGNTAAPNNWSHVYRDVGKFGDRVVAELMLYCDAIGTISDSDEVTFQVRHSLVLLHVSFASDGLFIYDGSDWNEVGLNLVAQDTWQKWVFDIDFSTPASATCDVYRNDARVATSVDCSHTGSFTNGEIHLLQRGVTTNGRLSYVDYVRIGDSCGGYSSSSSESTSVSSSSSESTSVSSSSSSESTSVSSSSSSESESVSVSSSSSSESTSQSSSSSESTSASSESVSASVSSSESTSESSSSESVSSSGSESTSFSSSSVSESLSQSVSSSQSESVSSSSSESTSASSQSESVSSSSSESTSFSSSSVSSSSESSSSTSVSASSSSSSHDPIVHATVMRLNITPHSPTYAGYVTGSAMSLTLSMGTATYPLYGRMGQPEITGSKPKVICEGSKAYVDCEGSGAKILVSGY